MYSTLAIHVHLSISNRFYFTGMDWMDPSDPTAIAESELLSAASSIEAAAKKLASLQARRPPSSSRVSSSPLPSSFLLVQGFW
jgi:hypothetical protein